MRDFGGKGSATWDQDKQAPAAGLAPAKRTLVEMLPQPASAPEMPAASAPVQRKAESVAPEPATPSKPRPTIDDLFGGPLRRVQRKAEAAEPDTAAVHASAQCGIATAASPAPHTETNGRRTGAESIGAHGKRTLTESPEPVQRKASGVPGRGADPEAVHRAAAEGTAGPGAALPYLDQIQRSFGRHDVRGVQAHRDAAAAAGAGAMGAEAFAVGDHVAFAGATTLHTAAHEAAHVVQQRGGVQLKGGVGEAGDAHEQHADAVADRVVRGDSAEPLLDQVAPAGGAPAASGAVQRIVRINGAQVAPPHHNDLVARVRAIFEAAKVAWLPAHENPLRGWLADHDHVIAATSVDALARNLHDHPGDPSQWVDMTMTAIAAPDMEAARAMRNRERFARLLEPTSTSTPRRVPGLGKLDDEELLRLQEGGKEEEQFWMRPSETDGEKLDTVKRKGITDVDEAHITAAGKPDDPSYVVALNNHHLGHRYVGSGRQTGTGNARTYGSKNDREGYEYKGSGLVDGHAIQVQDDQRILGPFQKDAPNWSTTVNKTDGTKVSYGDVKYLPKNKTDQRMIETHPHNFYWENQGQGQRMRQKAIEAPLMKSGGSFLHYNHFTGDTFHPNAGRAQNHTYDVPSRIHYRVKSGGKAKHYNVDNRPVADYSNPKGYNAATHSYPDIPSGVPKKTENKNLGGMGASEHLALAEMPDLTQFPNATVLHPEDPSFSFKPDFRTTVSGYESPPPTPYFAPDGIEEDERVEKGKHDRKRHFHDSDNQYLISNAEYDKTKKETKLTRKRRRVADPTKWGVDNDSLAKHLAARLAATAQSTGDTSNVSALGPGADLAMEVDDTNIGGPHPVSPDGPQPMSFDSSQPTSLADSQSGQPPRSLNDLLMLFATSRPMSSNGSQPTSVVDSQSQPDQSPPQPLSFGDSPMLFDASPPPSFDSAMHFDAAQPLSFGSSLDDWLTGAPASWLFSEPQEQPDHGQLSNGPAPQPQLDSYEAPAYPLGGTQLDDEDLLWGINGALAGGDDLFSDGSGLFPGNGKANSAFSFGSGDVPHHDLGLPAQDQTAAPAQSTVPLPAPSDLQPAPITTTTSPQLGSADLLGLTPSSDLAPPSSTTTPTQPSEAVLIHQYRIDSLMATLFQLSGALSPQYVELQMELQQLVNVLAQVDRNDPGQAGTTSMVYQHAVGWFQSRAALLYRGAAERRDGEPGDNAFGATGRRLASLRQFFSECAQMAVHNVLSLATGMDSVADETLLDSHGNYDQNLGEEQIRQMLGAAGRPDLPVIGNLGELMGMLEAFDAYGDVAAEILDVGIVEQAGHACIRAFGLGQIPVLNLIVNTEAAGRAPGTHWIAVQLQHEPGGEIAVVYLDSYDAPVDYSDLFDGLRAFFGAARRNAPPPDDNDDPARTT